MAHSSGPGRAHHRGCAVPREDAPAAAAHKEREWRRPIGRKGFGVLEDGTTFPLAIVEISYGGCKIETEIALFPGIQFRMSAIGGRSTVAARVQWHKDGCAGIEFLPKEVPARPHAPRAHERLRIDAAVTLRQTGRRHYQTLLFDLTPAGCKVEFVERPREGDLLWATFDGLEGIETRVMWVDGFRGGLKFTRPIHPGVFNALVTRLSA